MRLDKGSSELTLVGLLVIVTLAFGLVAIYAVPVITAKDRSGDIVDTYTATLHADGTLEETFVYNIVASDTRFLFRYWEEALVASDIGYPSDLVHLELLSIEVPPGTTAYLKDDNADVTLYSGSDSYTISELAYADEVGAFMPGYYQPGTYTVSYLYRLYFPVDSDGSYDHMNIQLARDHITYSKVKIVLEGVGESTTVFPHPPSLQMARSGGDVVITGSSAENEMLEIEMLTPSAGSPWRSWGLLFPESNTKAITEALNQGYSAQYWTAYSVNILSKVTVLAIPFALLGLWFRYGREEDVTVPTYLSTVPNPDRKPWYVNLIHGKGLLKFDENGFYATLLDLENRKKIDIQTQGGAQGPQAPTASTTGTTPNDLKIRVLDTSVSDEYESRVIGFLNTHSTTDPTGQRAFDTATLTSYATQINGVENPPALALSAQSELNLLMNPMEAPAFRDDWKKIPREMFTDNSRYLIAVAAFGGLFVVAAFLISLWAPIDAYLMAAPAIIGGAIIAQYVVAYLFPVQLMGRYKPGLYKEKLEWGSFKANLSDLSQMQKYGAEDLGMWGSWLVYGTALGVGDKVAQAMKSLNVPLATVAAATVLPVVARTHFHPLVNARRKVVYTSSGSHGGGGFKGGGGHRGGGGGHGGGGGRGGGGGGRR